MTPRPTTTIMRNPCQNFTYSWAKGSCSRIPSTTVATGATELSDLPARPAQTEPSDTFSCRTATVPSGVSVRNSPSSTRVTQSWFSRRRRNYPSKSAVSASVEASGDPLTLQPSDLSNELPQAGPQVEQTSLNLSAWDTFVWSLHHEFEPMPEQAGQRATKDWAKLRIDDCNRYLGLFRKNRDPISKRIQQGDLGRRDGDVEKEIKRWKERREDLVAFLRG
jgi:hypothetical protein